jgi:hypothetical protein
MLKFHTSVFKPNMFLAEIPELDWIIPLISWVPMPDLVVESWEESQLFGG